MTSTANRQGPLPGEQLLLSTFRTWAALRLSGLEPGPRVSRALAWRTSERTAALFTGWMKALEAACRRPLQLQCPRCGGASLDEQRLVVACGLAPVALDLGERLLEPLLADAGAVMILARALNASLAADGYPLPARLADTAPTEAPPTLH